MPQYVPLPGEPPQPVSRSPTDVLEVWFAGGHSDIGGGNYDNADKATLANITLRWMVREVVNSQVGIIFNSQATRDAGFTDEDFLVTSLLASQGQTIDKSLEKSMSTSTNAASDSVKEHPSLSDDTDDDVDKKDERDMGTSVNDALKKTPMWWLVEMLPFPVSWQDTKGSWHRKWRYGNFFVCVSEN